jgi:HEAT repeat protein
MMVDFLIGSFLRLRGGFLFMLAMICLLASNGCASSRSGPGTAALSEEALVKLLAHPDEAVRDGALTTLTGRGLPAVRFLAAALENPDPVVRHHAIYGLVRLAPIGHDAVPDVCEALLDPDPVVRDGAAIFFERGGPKVFMELFVMLRDPRPDIAAFASERIADRIYFKSEERYRAFKQAFLDTGEGEVPEALTDLLDHESQEVRKAAVSALDRFPEEAGAAAPKLVQALKTGKEEVYYFFHDCVRLLSRIRPPALAIVPDLRELLLSDNEDGRRYAGQALYLMGRNKNKVMSLLRDVGDLSETNRRHGRTVLGILEDLPFLDSDAVPLLLKIASESPDSPEKCSAIRLLGKMKCPAAQIRPTLLSLLGDDQADHVVRAWAADTLGCIGEAGFEGESLLRAGLQSRDPVLRTGCAGALWRLGLLDGLHTVDILEKALAIGSKDYEVRSLIAERLGAELAARDPEAIPLLVACLDEDVWSSIVAKAAQALIKVQTGRGGNLP